MINQKLKNRQEKSLSRLLDTRDSTKQSIDLYIKDLELFSNNEKSLPFAPAEMKHRILELQNKLWLVENQCQVLQTKLNKPLLPGVYPYGPTQRQIDDFLEEHKRCVLDEAYRNYLQHDSTDLEN